VAPAPQRQRRPPLHQPIAHRCGRVGACCRLLPLASRGCA
jgi:hypothetical protein